MAERDPIQPRVIWLSPMCAGCERLSGCLPENGQLWCVDPQEPCDECGLAWTRYVIDAKQAQEAMPPPAEPDDPS